MAKLRIGVFTDSYKPYTSGVVTSITTFSEELTRMGHEVYIFAPSYPHYKERERNVFRFFSVPAPTNPDYTLAVPISPHMSSVVEKLRLDIVHVHSPFLLGRWGAKCARRFGLPLVFTYHTLYDQYVHYVPLPQELAKNIVVLYTRYFCNRCDLVVAPSREIERMIKGYGIRTPVRVIPTGVQLHKFRRSKPGWLREQYGLPEDVPVCLFVGRLTREKNLTFLIDAFKIIKEQVAAAVLVLVAGGPLEEELKRHTSAVGLDVGRDVIFTGRLPFEQLVEVYFDATVFTFPSITETQGLVLAEAMAAGLPVVAVNAFGVRDTVDDGINGYLVELDKEQFAQRVTKLLQDETLRRSFAAQATAKAKQLSSRAMARKLESEYFQLLERPKTKPGYRQWPRLPITRFYRNK